MKKHVLRQRFFDKHCNEILEGMTIRCDIDGSEEKVYECSDMNGGITLGVLATRKEYLDNNPSAGEEYYPLSEFDMNDWEIVSNN